MAVHLLGLGALWAKLSPYLVKICYGLFAAQGLRHIFSGAVSVCVFGFFVTLLTNLLGKLVSIDNNVTVFNAFSFGNHALLDNVNYFFPLDFAFSVIGIYLSVYIGVLVFRWSTRIFRLFGLVAEKLSGQ